jgi:CheY-like chemotaxis protein
VRQSELLDAITELLEGGRTEPMPLTAEVLADADADTRSRPLHVLLAEDSPVNQRVASDLLERRGHSVRVVGTGREALHALEEENFDLVLMDVQMPEMDGLEATRAIRSREERSGNHVRIIAMTANAMQGDRERCLDAGMDDYIAKPIRAREFYSVIESWATHGGDGAGHEHAPGNGGRGARSLDAAVGRAAVGAASAAAAFDEAEALARTGGSREGLRELAIILAEHAPKLLDDARRALAAGDAAEVRRAAHTLKGSAALFGAKPTVDAALALETMGREGKLEGAEEGIKRLDAELQRLLEALRKELG